MIKAAQWKGLLEDIGMGLNVTDACQLNRMSRETVYTRAKNDKEFAAAFESAQLTLKKNCLTIIEKAAKESWTAAAWLLERKWPEEYASRQKTEVTAPAGGNIIVVAREK